MKNALTIMGLVLASLTVFAQDCAFVRLAQTSLKAEDFSSACLPIEGAKSCVVHTISHSYTYDSSRNLVAVPYVIIDNQGAKQGYGNVLIEANKCAVQYIQRSSGYDQPIHNLKAE